jgi:hypothetical protein
MWGIQAQSVIDSHELLDNALHLDGIGRLQYLYGSEQLPERFTLRHRMDIIKLAPRGWAIARHEPPAEKRFRKRQTAITHRTELKRTMRNAFRGVALQTLKMLHLKSPCQMSR